MNFARLRIGTSPFVHGVSVVNRWLEAGSGWSAPRRLKAGATSHGQRFPTRTSNEFLLHGLQVRILLGIAKKSRPTLTRCFAATYRILVATLMDVFVQ
jgi:hypothetical protein